MDGKKEGEAVATHGQRMASLASLARRQMNEQKKVDDVNNRVCNLGGSFDPSKEDEQTRNI